MSFCLGDAMAQNTIANDFLRVVVEEDETSTSERIEIQDNNSWVPLLSSLTKASTLLLVKGNDYDAIPLSLKTKTDNSLILESKTTSISVKLEIKLVNRDLIHFKYDIISNSKLKLSKLVANYKILLGANPTYKWVPHLRPKENYVIGDHVFRSPVIIYNKDQLTFALIPDLDMLGENRPFRALMDLNLKAEEIGGDNHIYYGFGNYKPVEHIFFKHNPKKKMKIKKGTNLSFGYYMKLFNKTSIPEILETVNSFLWEKYGRKLLYANLNPQILPYKTNVEEGFEVMFDRQDYWVNFKINDKECGGVLQNTWLGKKKRKLKFKKPGDTKEPKNIAEIAGKGTLLSKIIMHFSNSLWWIKRFDWFTRTFAVMNRTAEIWENAWFMNIRTGYSIRYFGDLWNDPDLILKGEKMLNTVLSLPRIRGVFPTIIYPASRDATEYSTVNGLKGYAFHTEDFNLVDVSLAMYWALKYYQDFEEREDTKEKGAALLDLIEEIQLENGAIPTYINFEEDNQTPIIRDVLIDSASSGAPLMFLMEYYKVTKDEQIIQIAEKIAGYLQKEIIPQNKWHDFEPFFSCTHFPMDFYCDYTDSHVMNALCIYWTAEGLKELYKITKKEVYLKSGEQVMAILNLFQQIWDQPYISFNTFGGFCSQNADAELSDARQGLFVRVYMEYYLITGKEEYIERGIATLRACWAMQLLKEYKEQCPGNIQGIGSIDGIDRGCVCENYGHLGNDFRIPGYIMFDWGVGSSASATAYVKKHFGDLFIDFKEHNAWGIDGIIVRSAEFNEKSIVLSIDKLPEKALVFIKARDVSQSQIELVINQKSFGIKGKNDLESGIKIEL